MKNLYLFVLLHCIADYPWQGDFLSSAKGKNDLLLFCHSAIWAGVIWMGFMSLGMGSELIFPWLCAGHFAIDRWKSHKTDKTRALTTDLYIDQALHAAQIISCFILWRPK